MWFLSTLLLLLALTGFSFQGELTAKKAFGEPAKVCMVAKVKCRITPRTVAAAMAAGAAAEVAADSSEPRKIIRQLIGGHTSAARVRNL
jgi:hypothetical protein